MSLKEAVIDYFSDPRVIAHYGEAVKGTGLWFSEGIVFQDTFPDPHTGILELGCGTGRITIGLHDLGYSNLTATDLCPTMVKNSAGSQVVCKSKFRPSKLTPPKSLTRTSPLTVSFMASTASCKFLAQQTDKKPYKKFFGSSVQESCLHHSRP